MVDAELNYTEKCNGHLSWMWILIVQNTGHFYYEIKVGLN